MAERDEEEGGDDDDDGEPTETISTREIEAQVRKAAKEKAKVVFQASAQHGNGWWLTCLQEYDLASFDPSDTSFMDRGSDDDDPPLRTREVAKKSVNQTRMRDSVDTMVPFRPTIRYPYSSN